MSFSGLFGSLRAERARTPRARRYVETIMADPADGAIRRLALQGDGDDDHARWELRYARRAIGLLVAERDALDDRTASEVAAELEAAHDADLRIAPDKRVIAAQQFNARLHGYRTALGDRSTAASTAERLSRVLLSFAGVSPATSDANAAGTEIAAAIVAECNGALRDAYGEASLPDDIKPSEI